MKESIFKIAGGNTTLLIEDCPSGKRLEVAQTGLERRGIEQVGFVSREQGKLPSLDTMGDELCVNGTIAFASTLGKSGELLASGINGPVCYDNLPDGSTKIKLDLPYRRVGADIVLFEGIGYWCTKERNGAIESRLWELAKTYGLPAFGMALYNTAAAGKVALEPIVYVDKLRSCVLETACGSGSIALSIVTGEYEITQRTGEVITVAKFNGGFTVSAEVRQIADRTRQRAA